MLFFTDRELVDLGEKMTQEQTTESFPEKENEEKAVAVDVNKEANVLGQDFGESIHLVEELIVETSRLDEVRVHDYILELRQAGL